jgi:hypothetical protein
MGCEREAKVFKAQQVRKQVMLDKGHFVRVAAIQQGNMVKVWFRDKEGRETERLMPGRVYDAIPLGVPATIEDYETINTALGGRPFGRVNPARRPAKKTGRRSR